MRKLRIYFEGFWPGMDMCDNFITRRLVENHYEFEIDPDPDYLFCSSFSNRHLRYKDCVKIYFTGENDVPDFNLFDYAMAFHPISFGDRYLRFPLYALYDGFERLVEKRFEASKVLDRKFCNFVYSNSRWADPFRDKFYRELSKYKKIDSGGRYLNNIGGPVGDKMAFIQDYKFTIAFENSSQPGYTTENLLEPMVVNSLPIYWGNPEVSVDFNERSFVRVSDKRSMEAAIEEIIRLDTDDEYYLAKMSEAWLPTGKKPEDWFATLDNFLLHIVGQPLEEARRCTEYGYTKRYKQRACDLDNLSKLFFWKKTC